MSLENARAFLRRIATDQEFAARIDAARVEDRGRLAVQAGYQFFQEEYDQAAEELLGSRELSDAELDRVAGGALDTPPSIRMMYGIASLSK